MVTVKQEPTERALQYVIGAWGEKTFPQSTPRTVVAHLQREVAELSDEVDGFFRGSDDPRPILSEAADCAILLLHLAHKVGFDLFDEINKKFAINQARTWGTPDAQGVVEHVDPDDALQHETRRQMSPNPEQNDVNQIMKIASEYGECMAHRSLDPYNVDYDDHNAAAVEAFAKLKDAVQVISVRSSFATLSFSTVLQERSRQISLGYNVEHDDDHSPSEWAALLLKHAGRAGDRLLEAYYQNMQGQKHPWQTITDVRSTLVELAAISIAIIDVIDRQSLNGRSV